MFSLPQSKYLFIKLQAAFVKAVAQQKQYKLHFWRYNASLNVKEITITRIAVIVLRQKIGGWFLYSHCDIFTYSCLKLKPIYITYLNATPCLKPDEIGFMFDCCSVGRSIMFDCLSVRFTNVRMCSIGKIFRRVRLSSIPEPNRSQSNDWSSIGFDYRTFDQLG